MKQTKINLEKSESLYVMHCFGMLMLLSPEGVSQGRLTFGTPFVIVALSHDITDGRCLLQILIILTPPDADGEKVAKSCFKSESG